MKFLKVGPQILNIDHIETVSLDVNVGETFFPIMIRMDRVIQKPIIGRDGRQTVKQVPISYGLDGKLAMAVRLFFEGALGAYPGFDGITFDVEKAYENLSTMISAQDQTQNEAYPAPPPQIPRQQNVTTFPSDAPALPKNATFGPVGVDPSMLPEDTPVQEPPRINRDKLRLKRMQGE